MRNLKKVLALVLALVMAMSLVTIANAADFSDNADIDYSEAVDVMVAAGIIDGVGNNSFDPNGTLTREQAAKLITYMLLGENSEKLGVESSSFKDVAATRWSAPAIEYCATMGIIDGAGDGNFYPAGKLTGYAFAKMLLTALGYKSDREGYTGPNWTINVATKALSEDVRLDAGLEKMFGNAELSRQEAAQMALNAIKAPLVEYDNDNTISVNGATVQINGGSAKFVTTTLANQQNISRRTLTNTGLNNQNSGYTVEFGERYLPKLWCDRDVDAFGRPSYTWSYDKKEIGTYIDSDLLYSEYTDEVTGKDLYDLLGSRIIKDYTFQITIDGVDIDEETGTAKNSAVLKSAGSYFDEGHLNQNNKTAVGLTGKGVLTQVFVESYADNTGKVWISVINTYLAQATGDYSAKKDEASLKVFALAKTGSGSNTVYHKYHDSNGFATKHNGEDFETRTILGEDFAEAKDMKKDDIVMVTVANGVVQTIAQPEIISAATLSAFSKDKYVISDDKQYDYNTTIEFDVDTLDNYTTKGSGTQQLKDTEYDLYLDPYGYLIGVKVVEGVKNYIFLTGIDLGDSNLNAKTAEAAGILLDGTFVNFKMNMKDSKTWTDSNGDTVNPAGATADNATTKTKGKFQGHALWNTWCTYTVDKDGTYTLTEVGDFASTQAANKPAKAGQYADVNAASKEIGTKRVSLTASNSSTYVYGNDTSIYLMAEVKEVSSKNVIYQGFPMAGGNLGSQLAANKPVVVISGVDSLGTGIDNVKVTTLASVAKIQEAADNSTASAYPGYIYTLFDNDGYVIAAVLLGEDDGSSKQLVYSNNDSVKRETYSREDDEWTWTREVIYNGEAIDLVEKSSSGLSKLEDMDENVWYEVTYKADGTVKDVKHAYYAETGKSIGGGSAAAATDKVLDRTAIATPEGSINNENFVDNIQNVEKTVANSNKSSVLYEEVWGLGTDDNGVSTSSSSTSNNETTNKSVMGENNAPSLKGSTLYVNTNAKQGFYVHKDVKSVLIQKNDGESSTTYGSGTSDLERFLSELNFNDTGDVTTASYLFKISAILVDGRATVVVIHDWVETDAQADDNHNTGSGDLRMTGIYYNANDTEIRVNVAVDHASPLAVTSFTYRITDTDGVLVTADTNNNTYTLTGDTSIVRGTLPIPYVSSNGAAGDYIVEITIYYTGGSYSGKETLRIR